jgi:hypothetical protein
MHTVHERGGYRGLLPCCAHAGCTPTWPPMKLSLSTHSLSTTGVPSSWIRYECNEPCHALVMHITHQIPSCLAGLNVCLLLTHSAADHVHDMCRAGTSCSCATWKRGSQHMTRCAWALMISALHRWHAAHCPVTGRRWSVSQARQQQRVGAFCTLDGVHLCSLGWVTLIEASVMI